MSKGLGIIIWLTLVAITLFIAFKVEKYKKDNDIQTYKEITPFMNDESLGNISKACGGIVKQLS